MIFEKVTFRYPHCFLCKHYMGEERCKAYPDGIPEDILMESIFFEESHECVKGVCYGREK